MVWNLRFRIYGLGLRVLFGQDGFGFRVQHLQFKLELIKH